MRVFVTGGTGFTGRRVVDDLLSRGHSVTCLIRGEARREVLADRPVGIELGDLADSECLARTLRDHDALVNVASIGFGHGPGIVAAAEAAGIRRAVFFSTTAVFTRLPAASRSVRLRAEQSIMASRLSWTILRPTMIYGAPGDRNVERLIRAIRRWPALPAVAGGGRLIQPVLVDDLAAAPGQVLANAATVCRCYSMPGRSAVTFGEFIKTAAAAAGRNTRLIPVPAFIALAGAALAESLLPRPRIRREQIQRLLEDKDFEWSAAGRDFGYDPAPVEEGLRLEFERLSAGGMA